MWIALNKGFLSAVAADPKRLPKADAKRLKGQRPLCIRARSADHLKDLFPGAKVYQWKGRDYPARIFIGADDFAAFVANQAAAVDYANFKSSVRDNELHDAYMGIWTVMHRYQHGFYKPRQQQWNPQTGYGYQPQREFVWGRGDRVDPVLGKSVDREEFDGMFGAGAFDDLMDEACTTPGCTDMNPCLDCIVDAMRDDPGPDGEDRYGAFDDRDDAGASSHLRVPPK